MTYSAAVCDTPDAKLARGHQGYGQAAILRRIQDVRSFSQQSCSEIPDSAQVQPVPESHVANADSLFGKTLPGWGLGVTDYRQFNTRFA